jgi:hypothetical protein
MSPAADTHGSPPLPPARKKLTREAVVIIAVLVVSTFTVILNEMLMVITLPQVMAALDISASTGQWLTTAYMLTMAVVICAHQVWMLRGHGERNMAAKRRANKDRGRAQCNDNTDEVRNEPLDLVIAVRGPVALTVAAQVKCTHLVSCVAELLASDPPAGPTLTSPVQEHDGFANHGTIHVARQHSLVMAS